MRCSMSPALRSATVGAGQRGLQSLLCEEQLERTIALLAEARMNVITLPTVSMDLQDRRPGPTPLMALHDARVRTACRECTSLAKPVPAQSMGVETGAIRAGQRANLTLFSAYALLPSPRMLLRVGHWFLPHLPAYAPT